MPENKKFNLAQQLGLAMRECLEVLQPKVIYVDQIAAVEIHLKLQELWVDSPQEFLKYTPVVLCLFHRSF